MLKPAVIDTNIVVSGLIAADAGSPIAKILDGMLKGEIPYLMSEELLIQYAKVLRRPKLANLHRLTEQEIDTLLAEIVANAMWREPAPAEEAPDSDDSHLWRLLASEYGSILVTGDKLLLSNPPASHSVVSPRNYIDNLLGDVIHERVGGDCRRQVHS
ncbi:MAG: putative toxin-antitoxin system toxin component, PIN family [Gammaproteobacteria bacterium]|nr:putative toxin-antitoxin system toxin component, PIN family [Gammaproteobacteria bacterium]MYA65934.1 putative toxin-antitoxin system toxin component, PIN family [Gammaproteobacteria bacterium]MYH47020.1 putative toxin-antitoxin system toxin component, PIN family [Gammaproteobacteria bacterium]MYL15023.1 putative toxin-antitoxin system toxin component, PIN family [Gammaproteobacteria bacterium]